METESVPYLRSFPQFNGLAQDSKVEPWRSQLLQICGVCKKWKQGLRRLRKPLFCLECKKSHRVFASTALKACSQSSKFLFEGIEIAQINGPRGFDFAQHIRRTDSAHPQFHGSRKLLSNPAKLF